MITSRFFLRLPIYTGHWLRTKYMRDSDRLRPVLLPKAHPVGHLIYSSLVCNPGMKRLSPICYTAQMMGIPLQDIPPEERDLFPSEEERKEFFPMAMYEPHYFLGVWIEDNETWQLPQREATQAVASLIEEMWVDVERYWEEFQRMHRIQCPGTHPVFWTALLDFCEKYRIPLDATDSMLRAWKRRKKRERKEETDNSNK